MPRGFNKLHRLKRLPGGRQALSGGAAGRGISAIVAHSASLCLPRSCRSRRKRKGPRGAALFVPAFPGTQMLSSIQLCSAALGAAPARLEITSPFLKMNSAGMPRTPIDTAAFGLLSTSTLATLIRPSISVESSSSAGPICLHGPHHSAQKSTTTGISEFFTSASKVSSVTATVDIGCLLKGNFAWLPNLWSACAGVKMWAGPQGPRHDIVRQGHQGSRGGPDDRQIHPAVRVNPLHGMQIGAHLPQYAFGHRVGRQGNDGVGLEVDNMNGAVAKDQPV